MLLFLGNTLFMATSLIVVVINMLLFLPMHECAHGLVALKLGDPTAKYSRRLTLNPIRHIDPLGAILMLLVGFGWAKPVPINPRNFPKPRRDMAVSAAAGPISNLLAALLFMVIATLIMRFFPQALLSSQILSVSGTDYQVNLLSFFFFYSVFLNITLAVFNLIPVPPLDGSHIFGALLPARTYNRMMSTRNIQFILMLAVLAAGRYVLYPITSFLFNGLNALFGSPILYTA